MGNDLVGNNAGQDIPDEFGSLTGGKFLLKTAKDSTFANFDAIDGSEYRVISSRELKRPQGSDSGNNGQLEMTHFNSP
ncbi:MAG: hypothetical protein QF541_08870 [Lentisphaeria bacterium]|nr:hypothetical protein [Lentisphaeria bacterium]